MANARFTIEDCLEMLMGYASTLGDSFRVAPDDASVFHSMSKQILKKKALTDRQYELLFEKLSKGFYAVQFAAEGLSPTEYQQCLEDTRMPLREIDRSKYIKLVDKPPQIHETRRGDKGLANSNVPWIEIGFPFSKKVIYSIDSIAKKTNNYVHISGEREHYFKCEENIVYDIINEFKNKEFEIDEELMDYFKQLQHLNNHSQHYLTKVLEGRLENFHPETEKYLLEQYGTPSVDNVVKYLDRSILFDIKCVDIGMRKQALENVTPLTSKIVHRCSPQILINPREWHTDEVVNSLVELDRLPLLVIVSPENALDDLKQLYSSLERHVSPSEVSVLFRLDNDTNARFNDFVKDQGFNTPVNQYTKVVVISKDKLPKPLFKAEWTPRSVLRLGSTRIQTKIDQWIYECDLVIHYDAVATQWQPPQVKRRTTETI